MLQLTQKLSNGEMQVQEVPIPLLGKEMILVQNHFSLISSGTEGSTTQTARKSLLGKAKERPQQVKQVLDVLTQQGPIQTYRTVSKKLEAYSPLGYSSAGVVISVGDRVSEFSLGDNVACAGVGYASHAEVIAVPVNLCVKLPANADFKRAAYNTLGAIALQGIRQADMRIGESCAVIGLGLLGHLTSLMLRASGVRVIGVDVNADTVEKAKNHCADLAITRQTEGIEKIIDKFTNGIGVDKVIITAATTSSDPINFAGNIARKKGSVIMVGTVSPNFDREPHWYKKELELRMSCSYGPGRYDLNYEEKGIDYPPAYVRWTEKRNMEAFQQLLADEKINIDYLTTHEYAFKDAPKAYDMIVNKTEPYLGIILKYNTQTTSFVNKKIYTSKTKTLSKVNLAFIGAGSYAQGNLLPNIPKNSKEIARKGILTNTGTTSKRVAERFGFEFCTSDENEILKNQEVNTVLITTRHDSHANYVIKSLKSGKHVFVEKPLCINQNELDKIIDVYESTSEKQSPILLVGYNRRFSTLSSLLKNKIGSGSMSMLYRINAGHIPVDTWIQDLKIGGGRIIGEACHFIDYLTWLNGSLPKKVYASALPDPSNRNDTINIQIEFENGSTGIVAYYANGPINMPKEYIEVFHNGYSGVLQNFKELKLFGRRKIKKSLFTQDKGQKVMFEGFIKSILNGKPQITFEEIVAVSKTSFAVLESIKTGLPVKIK